MPIGIGCRINAFYLGFRVSEPGARALPPPSFDRLFRKAEMAVICSKASGDKEALDFGL